MIQIIVGDTLTQLNKIIAESIQCVVTSPPYWGLRDYGMDGQIGLEETPAAYVEKIVDVFREVRRVLKKDGTCWLNLGDSYYTSAGGSSKTSTTGNRKANAELGRRSLPKHSMLKPKDLVGIPWRVAFALQADGWYLRQDIIWSKPTPMPESVTDRCTKSHEYIFLLTKSERYFYDAQAISEPCSVGDCGSSFTSDSDRKTKSGLGMGPRTPKTWGKHSSEARQSSGHRMVENVRRAREEGGTHDAPFGETRNKRSVWTVPTYPYKGAHFATFPSDLIRPCILSGSKEGDTVLDPFGGAGTTGLVCQEIHRNAILIDINPGYAEMAANRIKNDNPMFSAVSLVCE